jgi:D-amino-acid oxidase
MKSSNRDAIVVGSGVAGLCTAVYLQRAGWSVRIWAAERPMNTTSAVSAAIWLPFKASPEHLILDWSRWTFRVFQEMAMNPASGVHMREGLELSRRKMPDPWWKEVVDFERCSPNDLPRGFVDGYRFTVPVAETNVFLPFLLDCFLSAGGALDERRLYSLHEALASSDVVINCTGLAASRLVPDLQMWPVRGQVVRVSNPGLERFTIDLSDEPILTYIIPRTNDIILGGTADEGCFDTTADQTVTDAILARAIILQPKLAGVKVLEQRVGLRPCRSSVRLEREDISGGKVIVHNYGHGGSGVTVCWGCAKSVMALLESA